MLGGQAGSLVGRTGSGVGGCGATDPQFSVGLLVGRAQVLELPGPRAGLLLGGARAQGVWLQGPGVPQSGCQTSSGQGWLTHSWLWGPRCPGSWYQLAGVWARSLDGSQGVLKLDQLEWGCVLVPVS